VAAHLIEHGALHRENPPVRLVGRMGALQHAERLLEIARIGERAAIGAEQRLVFRVVDRGGLEHRGRLRALAVLAQRVGVADRVVGIARIGAEALAERLALAPPIGLAALDRGGNRSGGVGRAGGLAAGQPPRHQHGERDGTKQTNAGSNAYCHDPAPPTARFRQPAQSIGR
jgi:hypothetical protein